MAKRKTKHTPRSDRSTDNQQKQQQQRLSLSNNLIISIVFIQFENSDVRHHILFRAKDFRNAIHSYYYEIANNKYSLFVRHTHILRIAQDARRHMDIFTNFDYGESSTTKIPEKKYSIFSLFK